MTAVLIAWAGHARTGVVWLLAVCAVWLALEVAAAVGRRRPPLDDMDDSLRRIRKALRP